MTNLVEVRNVSKSFLAKNNKKSSDNVFAVRDVTLNIKKGYSLGLIGESGSGKTTLGRMICGLETATKGEIYYKEKNITNLKLRDMRKYRKYIQMIFQSNSTVFDPSYTIGDSLKEVLNNTERLSSGEILKREKHILTQVELKEDYINRYADELSGGERQRINIARALIINPEFVVCDEPVSSLDFSIRKQILNLLNDLKDTMGLTYLYITHDLSTITYVCDSVAIMYGGRIVEYMDTTKDLENNILHPYTKLLFQAIPCSSPENRKICNNKENHIMTEEIKTGNEGCVFKNRCIYKQKICEGEVPVLKNVDAGHQVACHMCDDK